MRRYIFLWMLVMSAFMPSIMAAEELPVIEVRADRTFIYPQRMELSGEETLLDILEMYPDLLEAGFDDLLKGDEHFDGWQLRMDNVALNGDTRLLLTQIKARLVSKIQLCHNGGVAKGSTGDGRVIDINLLKLEEGAHGFVSMQGGTDKLLAPSANLRYGSENTDIWSAMTYTHADRSSQVDNVENVHFQMTNRFSARDRLLSYVTQSSSVSDAGEKGDSKHGRNESIMARLRYFHVFNEQGTELLTLFSWQHKNSPSDTFHADQQAYRNVSSHTNVPIWLLELNTPLFVNNLTMMLGYEGDISHTRYGIDQSPVDGTYFSEESTYRLMNNDIYLQLNYTTGPWRFTLGDRVMFYHYKQKGYAENWSKNSTRNHFQASIVLKPYRRHQVQLAYFCKFRNPSAMNVYPDLWPDASGVLKGGNPLLEETKIDQYKLAYEYVTRHFTASLGGNIYHTSADENYWTIDGSLYKKVGILSLSGGFNVCHYKPSNGDHTSYADIRLTPTLILPCAWQVAAKLIWFSKDAPRRKVMDDTAYYGALQVNKQLGSHWDLQLMWHDMFYSEKSAGLAAVMYRF